MAKVSVLIPSRNHEPYLGRTVNDLFAKAGGDIEVIVIQDGPVYTPLAERRNLTVRFEPQRGIVACCQQAATLATGQYFMKLDAHCAISEGWDLELQQACEDSWVVIPRLYVLDAEKWCWQDERFYDYFYLCCPFTDRRMFRFQAGGHWPERTAERLHLGPIDDTMQFQGSCWFMSRTHFWEHLQGNVGTKFSGDGVAQEPTTIGLQTWLGPWRGRCVVNKNVWTAHMHKGRQHPRGYPARQSVINAGYTYDVEYWMLGDWPQAVHDVGWLVDRFWPVPGWPENYRELWDNWRAMRSARA